MDKIILGISRAPVYSPHSAGRDALLFNRVADEMRRRGHRVVSLSEDGFSARISSDGACSLPQMVFTMGRHPHVLQTLLQWERRGCTVVNTPEGIMQLSRRNIYASCRTLGITTARQYTEADLAAGSSPTYPCWLKRDDACAQQAGDVCFIDGDDALRAGLRDFARRGVSRYVVSEHLTGDLIKFYGVADTHFFHVSPVRRPGNFSKFGLERHNGAYQGYAFDAAAWQKQMDRLSDRLRVPVYGGDAVVDREGRCRLIDFNDWPSFYCCRDQAVQAIADCLERRAERMTSGTLNAKNDL